MGPDVRFSASGSLVFRVYLLLAAAFGSPRSTGGQLGAEWGSMRGQGPGSEGLRPRLEGVVAVVRLCSASLSTSIRPSTKGSPSLPSPSYSSS